MRVCMLLGHLHGRVCSCAPARCSACCCLLHLLLSQGDGGVLIDGEDHGTANAQLVCQLCLQTTYRDASHLPI